MFELPAGDRQAALFFGLYLLRNLVSLCICTHVWKLLQSVCLCIRGERKCEAGTRKYYLLVIRKVLEECQQGATVRAEFVYRIHGASMSAVVK